MTVNARRGEVGLPAGAQTYKVRFSFNALCALEGEFKEPVTRVFSRLEEDLSVRTLRALLRAGLECGEGKSFHAERVGDIIDEAGVAAVGRAIADAFTAAFPTHQVDTVAGEGPGGADPIDEQDGSTGTD